MIWNQKFTLEALNEFGQGNMLEHLGIVFSNYGDDFLEATLPVVNHNKQPVGLLHGGATATLAETLGSIASVLCIKDPNNQAVGVELNINHLKSAKDGAVTGRVTAIKVGRKMHVWNIDIRNDKDELISVSRLTTMIISQ